MEVQASDSDGANDVWQQTLAAAARRVDFRLTFAQTDPRRCHGFGIDGPSLPNAYRTPASSATAGGDWEDPDFAAVWARTGETEDAAIDRWFVTAVREAVHEALEWFHVDGRTYLDPHGDNDEVIHQLSEQFAEQLLALCGPSIERAVPSRADQARLPRRSDKGHDDKGFRDG